MVSVDVKHHVHLLYFKQAGSRIGKHAGRQICKKVGGYVGRQAGR